MSKTYIADKDTLDVVNEKIGTKDDAPSPNPISLFAGIKQLLKGLSDHMASWTGDRAAKVDYLDTTVGSRAPANTALSTAQWTNVRAGYLDKLNNSSYGLEAIKNELSSVKGIIGLQGTVANPKSIKENNAIVMGTWNGQGILLLCPNGMAMFKVTVDGIELALKDPNKLPFCSEATNYGYHIASIPFSKSVKVETWNDSSNNAGIIATIILV